MQAKPNFEATAQQLQMRLGIASLFSEEEQSKGLDGIKYWAFENLVKTGSKLPHRDWQELYASDF